MMHAAWLPDEALRAICSRPVHVSGTGPLVETILNEIVTARTRIGLTVGDAAAQLVLRIEEGGELGPQDFALSRAAGVTSVVAGGDSGLLHGYFHVVRLGEAAFADELTTSTHRPAHHRRMLDHWDNVDRHDVMGQVERGYSGGSLFWKDGVALRDEERVTA